MLDTCSTLLPSRWKSLKLCSFSQLHQAMQAISRYLILFFVLSHSQTSNLCWFQKHSEWDEAENYLLSISLKKWNVRCLSYPSLSLCSKREVSYVHLFPSTSLAVHNKLPTAAVGSQQPLGIQTISVKSSSRWGKTGTCSKGSSLKKSEPQTSLLALFFQMYM